MSGPHNPGADDYTRRAIAILRGDVAVPSGVNLSRLQYAVLLDASARHQRHKAAGEHELQAIALAVMEAMYETRRRHRPRLTEPATLSKGLPAMSELRLHAFAAIGVETIHAAGSSYQEAAAEVAAVLAQWLRADAPAPATVLRWRRNIVEDAERATELARFYDHAKAQVPPDEPLAARIQRWRTLLSMPALFVTRNTDFAIFWC
jgi:hypothetical protein